MQNISVAWLGLACALALSACGGGEEGEEAFAVWPSSIHLGLTDSDDKFSVPVGATGGTGLVWSLEKMNPRVSITGSDSGATLKALVAGADTLKVTSAEGGSIELPVLVSGYFAGAVERGQAAVARYGCRASGCHDANGPDFTPSRIGGFSDEELQAWIVRGTSLRTGQTVPNHSWPLTGFTEEQDVIAYLRSLPARGAPVRQ